MRTVIDDYGYIYPKLSYLKGLIMDEEERKKISSFSDIPSLINYSQRYFPDLSPRDDTLIAFERNLWKTFFKIFVLIYISF